ncbi:hypothetical protein COY16_04335 [Candidatus Roizmanbacteria bacterium CG_4_10_14_0_2_um_filter_39_13]|uniref:Integrase catalytic domain-containing protein n=1 Tax=Candidatus Roizmanbacteria bacterium CG_4_10_14_0_2_um_filter_39_13 TaxID=1974825 RepID=A0A2M7TXD8_9BACT|nr:MAG: hypothetical protein COY16_04335 [Candidatus Roizmanbacteria bacterium CG_4_10_14_0_2_um_filter_39_13]
MAHKINLTSEEETKGRVIKLVLEKKITNDVAAKQLEISVRQVKRLKSKVKTEGIKAVIHGLKGRMGNHQIEPLTKERALTLIKEKYHDFKPTFASEKLAERDGVSVHPETLRLWMIEDNQWKARSHKKTGQHHSWRARKECYGEMEQFDGSYHFWLEDRYNDSEGNPIEMCLLAAIDDATGKITKAYFAPHEGVISVFQFWKTYVILKGKPVCIYLDKFSTYKINHKEAVDNQELLTQFQRAMRQLGVNPIPANSPQAKGRIERLFQTLQDRLIKEMRLVNIKTPDEANTFLQEVFIPKFNERFTVIPAKEGDAHRELTKQDIQNLNRIFSVQSERAINNDFTVQFKTKWYQLKEIQPTTVRPKEHLTVEEWIDGTLHFNLREYDLSVFPLPERPQKMKTYPVILTSHKLNWNAPANHPWNTSISDKSNLSLDTV